MAEATGKRVKGKGPLIYNSSPAMCLMNYAEALEEEGTFGQIAKLAWKNASKAWHDFGQKLIPEPDNDQLYLGRTWKNTRNSRKNAVRRARRPGSGLAGKNPSRRSAMRSARSSARPSKRPSKNAPRSSITLAAQAEVQLEVTYEEIAKQVPVEKRAEAKKLAEDALENERIAIDIRRSRDVVNFAYWKLRAEVEQEDDARARPRGDLRRHAEIPPRGGLTAAARISSTRIPQVAERARQISRAHRRLADRRRSDGR